MRIIIRSVCVLWVALVAACGQGTVSDLPHLDKETISGDVLWERITKETDYRDYGYWPGHRGRHIGQAPHGNEHRIFVHPRLLEVLPIKDKTAPVGSIIVKENYDSQDRLAKITAMAKVKGYNPEHGDWFWAVFSPEGRPLKSGASAGCIRCHAGMRQNDYVIIHDLDRDPTL